MKAVRLARKALTDLHGIRAHVAADNATTADLLLTAFRDAFDYLAEFPHLGHVRTDLTAQPVRFWNVHGFLIIYRDQPEAVQILRVVRGSRDVTSLLR